MAATEESPSEVRPAAARADLHCHSSASEVSKLGVQRSAGLPECATSPEEVYEQAKARGMDFVTITDHDTIEGALEIGDRPDVFISEELTAWFRDEPRAVHVLCYGITPDDHEWLQAHAYDVELCAAYLRSNEITCALAHPFYPVEAPLTPEHRRRLARLFDIWETRNGSRASELNMPAAIYVDTHGGTGVAGSDDHAGVDIGRTFTRTPAASTPEEFLIHIRDGRAEACGKQGSAAKWAHAALGLASRALLIDGSSVARSHQLAEPARHRPGAASIDPPPLPAVAPEAILRLSERVVSQGSRRSGDEGDEFDCDDARSLLEGWLGVMGFADGSELLELMQRDDFSHSELYRRARAVHEAHLGNAVEVAIAAAASGISGLGPALAQILAACLPMVPYAPAAGLLAGEKQRLRPLEHEPRRVAVFVDGLAAVHGAAHTIERIRELGVPGYEVDVIGTDAEVDRRLAAVAEVDIPYYEGLRVGVPSIPSLIEVLVEGRYELIHLTSPGPANLIAAIVGRIAGTPLVASHHTDLVAYASIRTGEIEIEAAAQLALSMFYEPCEQILSPSTASDLSLAAVGVGAERITRWGRGVDTDRFDPGLRDSEERGPEEVRVLHAGRLTSEKGIDLLVEGFLAARRRDPRLRLVVAGGGPEEERLIDALGEVAGFLGWQDRVELARTYANSDIFLFTSQTDTFGQVIVEAQASGLPVVAVGIGGPCDLIDDGIDGLLVGAEPEAVADALCDLAASSGLRERIGGEAVRSARRRTWAGSMVELAAGYAAVLEERAPEELGFPVEESARQVEETSPAALASVA